MKHPLWVVVYIIKYRKYIPIISVRKNFYLKNVALSVKHDRNEFTVEFYFLEIFKEFVHVK